MSTKQNPGRFNCYEAAYPDETIFTLLARDPAFPATVRFWTAERVRLGKSGNEEDDSRIGAAVADAQSAEAWREANLDPLGDGVPTWRLPRQIDMTGSPDPSFKFDDCEGTYTMSQIAEIIAQYERDRVIDDPIIVEIATDHFVACPVTNPDDPEDEEYAVVFEADGGPLCSVKSGFVVGGTREAAIASARRIARLLNAGRNGTPVAEDPYKTMADFMATPPGREAIARVIGKHPALGMPYSGDTHGRNETAGERVVIDKEPDNLAHSPEVPPHRFSMFVKGEHYAYARGLEVAPVHLPVALDAMFLDGWRLVSIFGQTESKHVGFIFERMPKPVFMHFPDFPDGPSYRDTLDAFDKAREGPKYQRFTEGDSIDSIRDERDAPISDRGRAFEP